MHPPSDTWVVPDQVAPVLLRAEYVTVPGETVATIRAPLTATHEYGSLGS